MQLTSCVTECTYIITSNKKCMFTTANCLYCSKDTTSKLYKDKFGRINKIFINIDDIDKALYDVCTQEYVTT